jgi:hypothetical protein
MEEFSYSRTLVRTACFGLCNAVAAASFCVLWVWEYHIEPDLSRQIDVVVVPWLWLGGFFLASYVAMRGPKAVRASIICAVVFTFFLWLIISIVLPPLFDPWW